MIQKTRCSVRMRDRVRPPYVSDGSFREEYAQYKQFLESFDTNKGRKEQTPTQMTLFLIQAMSVDSPVSFSCKCSNSASLSSHSEEKMPEIYCMPLNLVECWCVYRKASHHSHLAAL